MCGCGSGLGEKVVIVHYIRECCNVRHLLHSIGVVANIMHCVMTWGSLTWGGGGRRAKGEGMGGVGGVEVVIIIIICCIW